VRVVDRLHVGNGGMVGSGGIIYFGTGLLCQINIVNCLIINYLLVEIIIIIYL